MAINNAEMAEAWGDLLGLTPEKIVELAGLLDQWALGGARVATWARLATDVNLFNNAAVAMMFDWYGGTATGGPNGDGRYPLMNSEGEVLQVASPAKIMDLVSGINLKGTLASEADLPAAGAPGDLWVIDGDAWGWSTSDGRFNNLGPFRGASALQVLIQGGVLPPGSTSEDFGTWLANSQTAVIQPLVDAAVAAATAADGSAVVANDAAAAASGAAEAAVLAAAGATQGAATATTKAEEASTSAGAADTSREAAEAAQAAAEVARDEAVGLDTYTKEEVDGALAGKAGLVGGKVPAAQLAFATVAEVRAGNVTGKSVDPATLVDADGYVAVAAAGAFALDFSTGRKFKVTLTANSTMTISGLTKEVSGVIRFQQDATGGRTLGVNAAIKKVGPYTLSVPANAVDRCGVEICNGVVELTALEKGIA